MRMGSSPFTRTIFTGHIPETLRRSSRFPTLQAKSRDRAGALMSTGAYPRNPCACCASALSQPQSLRDSPFQGHAGSVRHRRASPLLIRFANSLTLRRAADAALRKVAFRLCRQSPATAPVLITRPSSGSITRKLCEVGVIMVKNTPTCKGHCPYAAFCGILAPKVWAFFALFTPTFPSVDWKEEPLTLRRAADAALRKVAFQFC